MPHPPIPCVGTPMQHSGEVQAEDDLHCVPHVPSGRQMSPPGHCAFVVQPGWHVWELGGHARPGQHWATEPQGLPWDVHDGPASAPPGQHWPVPQQLLQQTPLPQFCWGATHGLPVGQHWPVPQQLLQQTPLPQSLWPEGQVVVLEQHWLPLQHAWPLSQQLLPQHVWPLLQQLVLQENWFGAHVVGPPPPLPDVLLLPLPLPLPLPPPLEPFPPLDPL
jgi:hypothetical protein